MDEVQEPEVVPVTVQGRRVGTAKGTKGVDGWVIDMTITDPEVADIMAGGTWHYSIGRSK